MLLAPVMVNVLALKVNAIDHSGNITMGTTQQVDVFVSYKRNQGVGEQNGDLSPMSLFVSWVADSDLSDSPTVKNSIL